MAVVSDRMAMIAGMNPVLQTGEFIYATAPDPPGPALAAAIASFREAEGLSLILPADTARDLGLGAAPAMRQITLMVYSSLEGCGLTAAVAGVLADAGIACNMVAALHHDHAFVPADRAKEAMALLTGLQARARAGNA